MATILLLFAVEAEEVGVGEAKALKAEITFAAVHAAFEHGADDLGDGGLDALGGVDGREVAEAGNVEGGVVKAAEAAEAEGGLGAGASVGEDMVAAGRFVGFLVIIVRISTL